MRIPLFPLLLSALPLSCAPAELKLKGLRVSLGDPIQVAAQLAWQEGPHGRWAFNHMCPTMAKFPRGELLVTYSLVADYNDNPRNVSGLQFSADGGRTWGGRHDFLAEHQPMIYVPGDGVNSLVAVPAYVRPAGGSDREFVGDYRRLENGGRRAVIEPDGVRIVEWPWPVGTSYGFGFFGKDPLRGIAPQRTWVTLCFDGSAVKVGNRLLATAYGQKQGDPLYRNFLLESQDQGRTWRYRSSIGESASLAAPLGEGAEGPNEPAMVELAGGELMAVFRVGSGRRWNLHRAYSRDTGRSWSRPEPLPAYSVEPSLIRLSNGILALSSGRPGIRLWLSADARGRSWQDLDIVEHHNRWAPDKTYRIGSYGEDRWQTSSYTEMVEVSPNRFLLVYDRSAKPQPEDNGDLTRIFVLPIEILRE